MGRFIYESAGGEAHVLPDRVLAHLEIAIGTKFRRGESFPFTIHASELPAGKGQRVFWMHPSIPVQFGYETPRSQIRINPAWIDALIGAGYSESGLRIVPEPTAAASRGPLAG